MDDAGFLADIVGRPDDTDVRLIYADFLEERGDEAGRRRAEFIRVQIELDLIRPGPKEHRKASVLLSRYRKGAPVRMTARTPATLLMREAILMTTTEAPAPVWQVCLGWSWHRGFVESVTCTAETWLGRLCTHCVANGTRPVEPVGGICTTCRGTGRVDASGPVLVLAAPLRKVTLAGVSPGTTDREPGFRDYFCLAPRRGSPLAAPEGFLDFGHDSWRDTEGEALADLSVACLKWAREQCQERAS